MKKRTRIVATLGPASSSEEKIAELIRAGVNVFRLNFSHGSHSSHQELIKNIRAASEKSSIYVGILGDLCGPKIRIGKFPGGSVKLENGASFKLYADQKQPGSIEGVGTSYEYLLQDVKVGDKVLLDDGNISLLALEKGADWIRFTVTDGGVLKDNKGMNLPGIQLSVESITEKDKFDLKFMIEQGLDFVALSFVRSSDDLIMLKNLVGDSNIRIISKIEKPEALNELERILDLTDGIMIARGDLGVEVPIEQVPALQKHILQRCSYRGILVITATQMLESMITNQRPTRAETTDVFNAIIEGSDAVMLSGETAAGAYPVEAVEMMSSIAFEAEKMLARSDKYLSILPEVKGEIEEIVAQGACEAAVYANAKAIVPFTHSGNTAHNISKYHPPTPIIALTPCESACRRLSMSWGVEPMLVKDLRNTDEMIELAEKTLKDNGAVKKGDIIVVVAGVPLGVKGNTNLIKLHRIS